MERYKCEICGFIYNPEEGDPASGIEPGIEFSDLPENYTCPICGAGKEEFFVYD
jgi:rubredoxin